MMTKNCCKQLFDLVGSTTPFDRCVVFEQGMAPYIPCQISGIIKCVACSNCYGFLLLRHTNHGSIYRLSKGGYGSITKLIDGYSGAAKPRWPNWVLPTNQIQELEDAVWQRLEPPTIVVATKALVNGKLLGVTNWDETITDWAAQCL